MLGDRRLFDDVARVASGAAGAFGGIRSRMEGELRDHVERLLSRMKLVTREEFEVVEARRGLMASPLPRLTRDDDFNMLILMNCGVRRTARAPLTCLSRL